MANKKYEITQDQLFQLQHFKKMFAYHSGRIEKLCSGEQDDIVYGFELGKIHSDLRTDFVKFDELEDDIRDQEIPNMDDSEPDYSNKKQW